MTDVQELIKKARTELLAFRIAAGGGPSVADTIENLVDALEALNRENKELSDSLGAIDRWGRDYFGPVRWLTDHELDSQLYPSPTHVLTYGPGVSS